jgi:hypothetical protein
MHSTEKGHPLRSSTLQELDAKGAEQLFGILASGYNALRFSTLEVEIDTKRFNIQIGEGSRFSPIHTTTRLTNRYLWDPETGSCSAFPTEITSTELVQSVQGEVAVCAKPHIRRKLLGARPEPVVGNDQNSGIVFNPG